MIKEKFVAQSWNRCELFVYGIQKGCKESVHIILKLRIWILAFFLPSICVQLSV